MAMHEANADGERGSAPARSDDWDARYARELPRVYNYFRFRVGDGAVAEDLTSTTFEKAWRGRERYREDRAAWATWLFAIARNVAIDHFRSRRPLQPLEAAAEVASGDDPLRRVEQASEFERLERLLGELPERQREIVALRFGAGWSHREIARAIRTSETNVGTLLHRAIGALRERWPDREGT